MQLPWHRSGRASLPSAATTFAVAPWCYALALGLWASSWNLRHSVLMSWTPLSAVLIGSFAIALCLVHRIGQPLQLPAGVVLPLMALVVCFLPGAVSSENGGYGPAKLSALGFIVLPVVCASLALLDSRAARKAWMWVQAGIGVAVAVGTSLSSGVSALEPGRLTLPSVDTISTGRYVGVAVLVLVLVGLQSVWHFWWALPLAGFSGIVLVQVGSRGPLLAAGISALIVVLLGRLPLRRRLVAMAGLGAIAVIGVLLAARVGGAGTHRIAASARTGFADTVREDLFRSAFSLGLHHPWGIGWGDFAHDSAVGHSLENAQGVAYAHSAVGEAFSEGGVLALLAYLAVVAVAVWRLWRSSGDTRDAVVLGTLLYWVLNAQVSNDFVGNKFMWISLACGLAAVARRPTTPDGEIPPNARSRGSNEVQTEGSIDWMPTPTR